MHKASMRESETFEQTVHRQEQNKMRMASMRECAAPRVWHFSAFHFHSDYSDLITKFLTQWRLTSTYLALTTITTESECTVCGSIVTSLGWMVL